MSIFYVKIIIFVLGTPLWLLLQISPVKNERNIVVLFLCTFRDITALKQPIEEETKGGLSKFAKLARSVTRSRSALASQLSNQTAKDPGKQSNLTQVVNSPKRAHWWTHFPTRLSCF